MHCMTNMEISLTGQVPAEVVEAEDKTSQGEGSELIKPKVNVVTRSGFNTGQDTDS